MKYIQQLSGKLGQSIRDYTAKQGKPDLELEKFAINSVVSATHTADMSDEDKNDIIRKIEKSGDDGGDAAPEGGEMPTDGEQTDEPTEENVLHERNVDPKNPSGCWPNGGVFETLPKDHKQVFADAKLGVDESEDKKMDEQLSRAEKLGIFGENTLRPIIIQKLQEMTTNDAPVKEPTTVPIVKPNEQPTRRQKPWKISPQPAPQPKAVSEGADSEAEYEFMQKYNQSQNDAKKVINIRNMQEIYNLIGEDQERIKAIAMDIRREIADMKIENNKVAATDNHDTVWIFEVLRIEDKIYLEFEGTAK